MKRFVGIDIGSFNTKIAEIEVTKQNLCIYSPVVIKTPQQLLSSKDMENMDDLLGILKPVITKSMLSIKKTIVVLNDTIAITRFMEIPAANVKETHRMIKNSISELVPDDISEYTISHKLISNANNSPGEKTNRFMAAFISNDYALNLHTLITNLKLKPLSFNVSMDGMFKLAKRILQRRRMLRYNTEKCISIIDLGASTIKILVINQGNIIHQQIIKQNARRIDDIISKSLGVDLTTAESYKIKYGAGLSTQESSNETEKLVRSIVNTQISLMLNDIYKNLQKYLNSSEDDSISEIWLCGGISRLKGIDSYTGRMFSVACSTITADWVMDMDKQFYFTEAQENRVEFETMQQYFPYFAGLAGIAGGD